MFRRACAISDEGNVLGPSDSVVITGGGKDGKTTTDRVTMYNKNGYVFDLPQLNTARNSHGCGYYRFGGLKSYFLVAGGVDRNRQVLATTEIMTLGETFLSETKWQVVAPLPVSVFGLRGASNNFDVFMFGWWKLIKSFYIFLYEGGYDGSQTYDYIWMYKPETGL